MNLAMSDPEELLPAARVHESITPIFVRLLLNGLCWSKFEIHVHVSERYVCFGCICSCRILIIINE
jgi:hypothetical protein